jgi:aspartyl-tRNA(Asn)/glutamyl-tRNA(Gln) amidotransferase subunit C
MSSKTISAEEIRKVAKLARIKLTTQEEELFTTQLAPVLGHIDNLNSLDTTNILPTAQVTSLNNILRDDIPTDSFSQEQSISSTSNSSNGYFVMPKTIDK